MFCSVMFTQCLTQHLLVVGSGGGVLIHSYLVNKGMDECCLITAAL